jgi:NADH dehydrogenase (ubiquinone) 1 alpha subcomplex subunit 5
MRATLRLLATAQKAKFLTPGAPTGLTGLFTHPAPRSALIYLYSKTLDRLAKLPEESVYRTATEALTKQRLQIVQSVVPEGFEAWQKKVAETVKAHPEVFAAGGGYDKGRNVAETFGGKTFVSSSARKTFDDRTTEWDGEVVVSNLEGTRTDAEKTADLKGLEEERPLEETKRVELDEEPPLTAEQYGL